MILSRRKFLRTAGLWLPASLVRAQDFGTLGNSLAQLGTCEPDVENWMARVVANGGALPSLATKYALCEFVAGCKADGVWNDLHHVGVFAPDSDLAMRTPLKIGPGFGLWAGNPATAHLSLSGLQQYASTNQPFDTGVRPDKIWSKSNWGTSFFISGYNAGTCNPGGSFESSSHYWACFVGGNFCNGDSTTASMIDTSSTPQIIGFYSGNRTAANAGAVYYAHPNFSWRTLGTTTTTPAFDPIATTQRIGSVVQGGVNYFNGTERISFMAYHNGLVEAKAQALYSRVVALRAGLGGGDGTGADLAANWGRRVVANGGAAPAAATISACGAFLTGLMADGLAVAKRICVANVLAPDNLTAALTPLVPGAGADPWGNNNFVSGDLTVNGLKGNGSSKYLNTGINPNATFATTTSGGLVQYISEDSFTGGEGDFGCLSAEAFSAFYLAPHIGSSVGEWKCWKYLNPGADYLQGFAGSSNKPGFYSGQRTAANAIAVYFADSGNAHASLATGSGSQTGVIVSAALYAFALNVVGSPGSYSAKRLSFLAMTNGLSAAESAQLYARVQALRTALGGGYV